MNRKFPLHPSLVETIAEASSAAETKCQLNFGQGIALGVMASAFLALATTLALAMGATIESPSVQKLVMGAVFPVGLIAVVVAGSELSTGNYMITPFGAMTGCIRWRHVLHNWAVSYAGNFLGAFLLAAIVIRGAHLFTGAMWGQAWIDFLAKTVVTKANLSFMEAFWRGFLCIWLVDLAVWQAYRVKEPSAKFLLVWFPTMAFFALGLEHSVVNMFLFPAGILAGADVTWEQFLLDNLMPVVLGNVVGGMFIMGMLYWFSAGLPVRKPKAAHSQGEGGSDFDIHPGSYSLLWAQLLRSAGTASLFMVLFPGGGAAIAALLPGNLGVIIPVAVIVYLALGALLFPLSGGHRSKTSATGPRGP